MLLDDCIFLSYFVKRRKPHISLQSEIINLTKPAIRQFNNFLWSPLNIQESIYHKYHKFILIFSYLDQSDILNIRLILQSLLSQIGSKVIHLTNKCITTSSSFNKNLIKIQIPRNIILYCFRYCQIRVNVHSHVIFIILVWYSMHIKFCMQVQDYLYVYTYLLQFSSSAG